VLGLSLDYAPLCLDFDPLTKARLSPPPTYLAPETNATVPHNNNTPQAPQTDSTAQDAQRYAALPNLSAMDASLNRHKPERERPHTGTPLMSADCRVLCWSSVSASKAAAAEALRRSKVYRIDMYVNQVRHHTPTHTGKRDHPSPFHHTSLAHYCLMQHVALPPVHFISVCLCLSRSCVC
jgi:hypothetical protein